VDNSSGLMTRASVDLIDPGRGSQASLELPTGLALESMLPADRFFCVFRTGFRKDLDCSRITPGLFDIQINPLQQPD
jgi:hypothetical protein